MQQPYNTDPREQPGYSSTTNYASPDPQSAFGPTSAYVQPTNGAPVPYPVPYAVPVPVPTPARGDPGATQALTSLILGVVSLASIPMMLSIFLFICGAPLAVTFSALGIIFGALGLRSTSRRRMAITGIVLSSAPLALAIVFAIMNFLGVGPFGY